MALSYASENRGYVDKVANALRSTGVRVFYDQFLEAELWGADLYTFFDDVFRTKARFAVVFISSTYVTKVWPNHERQSVQARALVQTSPYLLPVRLDDSELPGLRPTVGYIDGRTSSPEALAALVVEKVGSDESRPDEPPLPFSVPETPDESRQLLAARPAAWEYLLLGGVLLQGKQALESKWYDHQLTYRPTGAPYLASVDEAVTYLKAAVEDAPLIVENLEALLASDVQERAFRKPGEAGEPALIQHLGQRVMSMYEDMLDWSARLRAARVPDELQPAFSIAANFMDRPLKEVREFLDDLVAQLAQLPARLRDGRDEPIHLIFELKLTFDERVAADFNQALEQATSRRT